LEDIFLQRFTFDLAQNLSQDAEIRLSCLFVI